jgi:hypothetical protein
MIMSQKTSLCHWYPLVKDKLPTPRTEIMPLKEGDIDSLFSALDGKGSLEDLKSRLLETASRFNYPLFMRTDFTSGKHDFKDTCYVQSPDQILGHALALFEDTICKDISIGAYVFREFLQLESKFTAFRGLPISKERRYFVEDGVVLCHHPYWPEDAIRGEVTRKGDGWKTILKELNTETQDEIDHLSTMAKLFSILVDGAWSVDFAKLKDGSMKFGLQQSSSWVLIDAAEAFRSWHPSDCPIAFGE